MDKLDEMLRPMKEYFIEKTPDSLPPPDLHRKIEYEGPVTEFGRNIRLDFEISDTITDQRTVMNAVFDVLREDLEDLLQNGDVNLTNDALLKVLDGEVKRGKPFDVIATRGAILFSEHKKKKEAVEYTLYINLLAK